MKSTTGGCDIVATLDLKGLAFPKK